MHRKVAAALIAAFALGIAGCGSGTTTLTRAELVKRVEAACREGQVTTEKEAKGRSSGGVVALALAVRAGQKVVMDKVKNIEASGAARADWDKLKEGMQRRLDAIERVANADRAHAQSVVRSIERQAQAASEQTAAAEKNLGIKGCLG